MARKLELREDLLAPGREAVIEFDGKNAIWIMGAAMKMLQNTLKVSAVNLREDRVNWDATSDAYFGFFGEWRGFRTEDRWTRTKILIRAHGQHRKDGTGYVKIWLRGWLHTKVDFGSPISGMLWHMYNLMFYYKQRRAYLEFSKGNLMSIREQIKKAYGILEE